MSYSDTETESDSEVEEETAVTDMISACKHGHLAKVTELLEREGDEFARRSDKEGHTFVHWAALGGSKAVVELLLEKGAPLNQRSNSDHGPLPVHWACVQGHVKIVDLFFDRGVSVDATDLNGCSPLLVAAQYGQSLCVSYLLQKGANRFHVDSNGDSALHWAGFKGFPEVVFVLVNAGLSASQKDTFGQTPLHSASIKGDILCAEILVEHGANPEELDNNGKTPKALAIGRRHRQLVKFLDKKNLSSFWDWRTVVYGPHGRSRAAVVFYVLCMFLWAYPMYFLKAVPLTLEDHYTLHSVFWVLSIFMWMMFVWCKFSNPGYVKINTRAYEEAVQLIGNPSAWGDYNDISSPIYNICHTCKTVRPVRAKHCRQCNKCVEVFDHHCPWVDNCVAVSNRVPFTIFLYILGGNGLCVLNFIWLIWRAQGLDFVVSISILFFCIFFISGVVTFIFQTMVMFTNLTTNERANYGRYRHFKTEDGKYRNPFDRGFLLNGLEYWHLVEPRKIGTRQTHIV